jgi:hypothetical protein
MKMKNKIIVLFMALLFLGTTIVITTTDIKVKASSGGGSEDIGLDYNLIKDITKKLSDIVNDSYENGDLIKGRYFGSVGELDAADYIKDWMKINCSLSNVYFEKIEDKRYLGKNIFDLPLNASLDVLDRELIVIENGQEKTIEECHINPRWNLTFFFRSNKDKLNHTFTENNLNIYHTPEDKKYFGPGNYDWFKDFFDNVSLWNLIKNNDSIFDYPSFFNFTINEFQRFYKFTFEKLNASNSSTFPDGMEIWQVPDGDFVLIQETNSFKPKKTIPPWLQWYKENYPILYKFLYEGIIGNMPENIQETIFTMLWYKIYEFPTRKECKGFIIFDHNNKTYDMNYRLFSALPIININGTLGNDMNDSVGNYKINYTLNQMYNTSVNSKNVIGQINGTDNDKTVLIGCLYDGWWNQATADSAIGMGIVLSIAKYMKELKDNYSIDPKYKVKFIGFSGEEAGLRGAKYYESNHSIFHNYEYIKTFIDLNQFGFNYTKNQESLHMNLTTNNRLQTKILKVIADKTNFQERSKRDNCSD